MGRYLEIAKRAKERSVHDNSVIAPELLPNQLPVSDPYAEAMQTALNQIKTHEYVVGMVPWLDTVYPDLYEELTSRLPDEIHRLWSERAPLERFEIILSQLISLHDRCCALYRTAKSATSTRSFGLNM